MGSALRSRRHYCSNATKGVKGVGLNCWLWRLNYSVFIRRPSRDAWFIDLRGRARRETLLAAATLDAKTGIDLRDVRRRGDIKRTYETLILIETIKYYGHLATTAAAPVVAVVLASKLHRLLFHSRWLTRRVIYRRSSLRTGINRMKLRYRDTVGEKIFSL